MVQAEETALSQREMEANDVNGHPYQASAQDFESLRAHREALDRHPVNLRPGLTPHYLAFSNELYPDLSLVEATPHLDRNELPWGTGTTEGQETVPPLAGVIPRESNLCPVGREVEPTVRPDIEHTPKGLQVQHRQRGQSSGGIQGSRLYS
jgi:hypothetical protein